MKVSAFRQAAFAWIIGLSSLVGVGVSAQEAPPPSLKEVLALRGGKVVIFQPVQIKQQQRLLVTHIHTGGVNRKNSDAQAVALILYSTTPDQAGEYPVVYKDIMEAGPGGGPRVKVFSGGGYTHPQGAPPMGIIGVLIGLRSTANGPEGGVPAPLPSQDSFSAQLDGGDGVGLLIPAVQTIREAARR